MKSGDLTDCDSDLYAKNKKNAIQNKNNLSHTKLKTLNSYRIQRFLLSTDYENIPSSKIKSRVDFRWFLMLYLKIF